MAWLKKVPGISLLLLLLTYGVEGWMYGSWTTKLLEQRVLLPQLTQVNRLSIIYGITIAIIIFLLFIFTSPIGLSALGFGRWLRSDTQAFFSIFFGAFAFALVVQRVDYFARFLVFAAAALLLKLDLQLVGCDRWLSSIILTILGCLGFTGGILAFYSWG